MHFHSRHLEVGSPNSSEVSRWHRFALHWSRVIHPDLTDLIITQGRALVRAIEALGTIEPTGPFERVLARLRSG
jgi:hypothetical protein